jgi:Cu/Ag efflux pump CusA
VVDLSVEQQTDIPTMRFKVDQAAAARYGVRAGEVTEAVQTAFVGSETGQVLEGQVSFPLVVRYRGDKP